MKIKKKEKSEIKSSKVQLTSVAQEHIFSKELPRTLRISCSAKEKSLVLALRESISTNLGFAVSACYKRHGLWMVDGQNMILFENLSFRLNLIDAMLDLHSCKLNNVSCELNNTEFPEIDPIVTRMISKNNEDHKNLSRSQLDDIMIGEIKAEYIKVNKPLNLLISCYSLNKKAADALKCSLSNNGFIDTQEFKLPGDCFQTGMKQIKLDQLRSEIIFVREIAESQYSTLYTFFVQLAK